MMTNLLIIFFGTAILIWLVILSFLFVRIFTHYKTLVRGANGENLERILKKVLARQDLTKKEIEELDSKVALMQKGELSHIQKVGFVRFNPFDETGGDNSFALALMDAKFDGVVITGLHTREKTKLYAKSIHSGTSKYELSKEEKRAIEEATK